MKRLAYILMAAAFVLTACAKEEYEHPSEANAPKTASEYVPVVTVDQELNQVTFSLGEKGVVPVWVFQNKDGEWADYQARDGYKRIFTTAGDYSVRMFVMNSCGVTPDYVETKFHIDNTIMSFEKYIRQISGGSEKVWRIDNKADAHMACGPSVESPFEWWAAKADEKAAFGIYDNRLTFSSTGDYTFNPGESGTIYVNVGVKSSLYAVDGETADYTVPAEAQTVPYEFAVDGNDLILKLQDGARFPYIPNDDFITDTKFHVASLDNNSITLVWYTPTGNGGGSIAWQFILTSKEPSGDEPGGDQGGYTYGENLLGGLYLKDTWFSPGDWSGGLDPKATFENGTLTLTVPDGVGGNEWQGQVKLVADIPADPEKQYSFSCKIESSSDGTCTVKLADAAADAEHAFFYDNGVKLAAYDVVAYKNEPTTPDQAYESVMVIFDFGRMPAGTEITVSGLELKEITGGSPGGSGSGYTYGEELLGGLYLKDTWFSPGDWSGGLDPKATFENGTLTLTVPDGVGGNEWQGQVKLVADIPADPEKQYSFSCKIESSSDGTCTVKLADAAADAEHAFFYDNGVKLAAYDVVAYKNEPTTPDQAYESVMVIFDFGRMPAGTEITISDISLKEITGESGGSQGGETGDLLKYDSPDNLWLPVDAAGGHTFSQYYATTGSWTVLPNPEITDNNGSYSFTLPTETMNQWQAQFFIIPVNPISLSAEKKYDFQCTVELSQDVKQVTFKLTDTTDDGNFLFTERRDITAYDTFIFSMTDVQGIDADAVKMVFDFGGNPADTEVLIKDIILREHK